MPTRTPDIKLAMGQIEEISRKTAGDHSLKVAYDDDSTWPLEWYLRDYPNKVYYGANPTGMPWTRRSSSSATRTCRRCKPYLGDRYYEFTYRLIWWPRRPTRG